MPCCYLALGSNLENPAKQVAMAIEQIASQQQIRLIKQSSLYQTQALLHPERLNEPLPDYINAVIRIETSLNPMELLRICQMIESSMGRIRSEKIWDARVIDIDILLFDQLTLSSKELTLPHPQMLYRKFVIEPLFEIAPDLILPDGTSLVSVFSLLSSFL